jgi:ABC-type transport system substrate-binding protein
VLPTSARFYLALNLRRSPFANVQVRRAIAAAIDRHVIVSDALGGVGAPAVGWYTPDVEWAYNAAVRVPDYNPNESRALLDGAGLRVNGSERFRASLVIHDAAPMREIALVLQKQLAAVGITITIERVEPSEWPKRVLAARHFDLTLVSGGQGPDPDALRRRFLADSDTGAYIGYSSPDFRDAVDRGARTVDLNARAAAYHKAQEILARDVPFIPLAESVKVIVHNQRVSGLPQLEARGLVGTFDFSLVKLGAARGAAER